MTARYAVYLAPAPESALWKKASAWLGWNAATGEALPQHSLRGPVAGLAPPRIEEITAPPRFYGFHATIKAPFALAPGVEPEMLYRAADEFARGRAALRFALKISALSSFLAMTECQAEAEVAALHTYALNAFEPYRAALPQEEIRRRLEAGLSARQQLHLVRFGYPYVQEDFRLHFTLTGPLEQPERDTVAAVLEAYFADTLQAPIRFDALSIFTQTSRTAPFRLVHRSPFAPA